MKNPRDLTPWEVAWQNRMGILTVRCTVMELKCDFLQLVLSVGVLSEKYGNTKHILYMIIKCLNGIMWSRYPILRWAQIKQSENKDFLAHFFRSGEATWLQT